MNFKYRMSNIRLARTPYFYNDSCRSTVTWGLIWDKKRHVGSLYRFLFGNHKTIYIFE